MSDEIFRLVLNERGQWDIYDNEESKRRTEEKGYPCICIYNDLGNVNFSSAPQLCELLNELSTENRQLMQKNKELLNELDYQCTLLLEQKERWKDTCKRLEQQYLNLINAIVKTCNDLNNTEEVYLGDFDICKRITEYEKELSGDGV